MTFREYLLSFVKDIPQVALVLIILSFFVGLMMLLCIWGLKKGFRWLMALLLVEYVFLLLCSTIFFRRTYHNRKYDFTPFWSYCKIVDGDKTGLLQENIMNVVAFVPVGLLLGAMFNSSQNLQIEARLMVRKGWVFALFTGLGLSVGIEFLQFVYMKGFSEVDDVMHNTIGCLVGYVIWLIVMRIWNFSMNWCK